MSHVPVGTLIDYIRGIGAAATRGAVGHHLSACARCSDEAARLARLALIARADADPPDDVVDAAITLFNGGRGGLGLRRSSKVF